MKTLAERQKEMVSGRDQYGVYRTLQLLLSTRRSACVMFSIVQGSGPADRHLSVSRYYVQCSLTCDMCMMHSDLALTSLWDDDADGQCFEG